MQEEGGGNGRENEEGKDDHMQILLIKVMRGDLHSLQWWYKSGFISKAAYYRYKNEGG